MDKIKLPKLKTESDVHIEQVNKQRELNDLEKTAVMQFLIDEQEKDLSKTQQLKILNSKKKRVVTEFELPKMESTKSTLPKKEISSEIEMPKKVNNLTDTIRIKLSDLRAAVQKREQEALEKEKEVTKKKSLYDTIIIKLDDIINNRKALKSVGSLKVVDVQIPLYGDSKKSVRVKDITKAKEFKLNVDSIEFMSQLRNLNVIALNKLSSKKTIDVRKNSDYKKNHAFEKIKVPKEDYLAFKDELTEFAIDKLYYQYALKETKKYKMYKASVALSVLVFLVTSLVIFSWFVQGVTINNLSNSLTEVAPVEKVEDGTLINVELIEDIPTSEDGTLDKETVKKNDMYWQYLNTPLSSIDFTQLLKQNKDTVGWLIVNNTNINYPVVQTTNNDYYLKHAFDRSKNYAGWVYADFRNNFDTLSKNTVIYAHGRKDGVMFGSLNNALKKNWYTNLENQIIQLSTIKYNTMWQIFSVYKIEAESYYITTDFSNSDSFGEFVKTMEERSIYDFGVDVSSDDRLLTLSTCFNDKGTRLVVQAKLVKIQER
ncbi:MAG: class B sortase [Firmicutes bacterium]|nr:class B sortase [Bacillota bacterium]